MKAFRENNGTERLPPGTGAKISLRSVIKIKKACPPKEGLRAVYPPRPSPSPRFVGTRVKAK